MHCARCHRPLKREPLMRGQDSYGPKCYAALFGKEHRAATPTKQVEDERQTELWPGSIFSRAARFIAAWWNDVTEPGVHL